MACAAGAMLLAGLGGSISPAFSQGPMAPRMDVAPPPVRVAPPPPPPVFVPPVVPTPPPMPVAPVMAPPPAAPKAPTASAPATPAPVGIPAPIPAPLPATASKETPRGPGGGPPPYTDSQVKALRGVGVSLRGPGGQRQATTDSNGVVSLGKLGKGTYELSVDQKSLGTGTQPGTQPVALIGLLLPAVQKLRDGERRYRTLVIRPANDQTPVSIRLQYDDGDGLSNVDVGNRIGGSYDIGGATLSGRADIKLFEDLAKRNTSGETRLVFVTPVPGSTAAALADANAAIGAVSTTRLGTSQGNPTSPDKPQPNYTNQPIPGIDVVVQKKPSGGKIITQGTDSSGTTTLGVLTPGTHSVSLDTRKLLDVRVPGPSGSEPAQPAGILIGLLLPAVQKLGEAPQPTTVEHAFPRSFLANAKELRIDIVVPDGGGSPKVDWGDGSPSTDVVRDGIPAPSALRVSADVSTIRVQNYLSSPQTGPGGPGTPTAQEAPVNTSRSNIKRPSVKLPNVGVTSTGPGGVMQARSDGEGWTRLGKLPIGNTIIEFNGADLASALKTTVGPNTPEPQKTLIELLVVIAITAIRTDGTPVVFTGSVPASAVKTVKADLRVGRDGNAMAVDWGNGPQLPQILSRTGAATLTVPGPNGPIPVDPALVKSLQDRAGGSAPGLVEANTAMGDISTTR